SGVASFTTTALSAGTHSITASYAGDAGFAGSASAALSQQVGYTVKVLSNSTAQGSPLIALQLLDFTGANVSASTLAVTAKCVVAYGATAPTTCAAPIQTIKNGTFSFNRNWRKGGPTYTYQLSNKGLTSGTQYYL